MTNPVLARSRAFNESGPSYFTPQQYSGQPGTQYATPAPDPTSWATPPGSWSSQPTGAPAGPTAPLSEPIWPAQTNTGRQSIMTLDDVLTKTGVTLGLTAVVALLAAWVAQSLNLLSGLYMIGIVCGLATIIFPFVAAARRKVGPGIAIGFAVLEGVFLGAFSMIFEMAYPGIVFQAVIATFIAAGLTLVAFRYGKFRISNRIRKVVMMSMIGYGVVAIVNLILYFFGINLGMFPGPGQPVSWLAWAAAGVGVVLAVLSLVDDFQYVEQGIINRAPASESWRAAYGLTVTMVWLYVNILRILSYLRR